MSLSRKKIILPLIAFFLLAVYQNFVAPQLIEKNETPQQSVQGVETKREEAQIIKVIDGDTVEVLVNNEKIKVRVIGIDTPEVVDPRRPVECFGKEASDVAKQLLTGQTVLLESDPSQGEQDKYGRMLRYIWRNNGESDFGKEMIAKGYAYEFTYDEPYKYRSDYKLAQQLARQTGQGLWKEDACNKDAS